MRNLKKVLALVLALMMTLSLMVTASASDYTDDSSIQKDVAVDVMSALEVFNGINGEFQPGETLSRAQAAKIIAYLQLGPEAAEEYLPELASQQIFDDVEPGKWYAGPVNYCANLGIVNGVGDNKFNPKGPVKGYEFAKMLMGALGYSAEIEGYNASDPKVGSLWTLNVSRDANALSTPMNTNVKYGSAELTREEACQMAFNILNVKTVASYDEKGLPVEGKTLGESVFNMDSATGVVKAIGAVTQVESNNYAIASDPSLLGHNVTVYYSSTEKDEKDRPVGYTITDNSITVEMTADADANTAALAAALGVDKAEVTWPSTTPVYDASKTTQPTSPQASVPTEAGTAIITADEKGVKKVTGFAKATAYYLDKVDSIDKDGNVTLKGAGSLKGKTGSVYKDVAEGDYVTYYTIGANYYVSAAETVVGALSAFDDNSVTVNGTKYKVDNTNNKVKTDLVNVAADDLDFTTEFTVYLNPNGTAFVVVAPEGAKTTSNLVYVIKGMTIAGTGSYGEQTTSYAILGMDMDGNVDTYPVTKENALEEGDKKIGTIVALVADDKNEGCYKISDKDEDTASVVKIDDSKAVVIAADDATIADSCYYGDSVKFIYINDDNEVTVVEGVQKIKADAGDGEGVVAYYITEKVEGDETNKLVNLVIVPGDVPEAEPEYSTDVIFANEAEASKTRAPYTDANGDKQTGYEHTVYIDGEKQTIIVAAGETAAAAKKGFYNYAKDGDAYTLKPVEGAKHLTAEVTFTNVFSNRVTVAETDKDGNKVIANDTSAAGATVINTTGDDAITVANLKGYKGYCVLSEDGKTIVTVYVTGAHEHNFEKDSKVTEKDATCKDDGVVAQYLCKDENCPDGEDARWIQNKDGKTYTPATTENTKVDKSTVPHTWTWKEAGDSDVTDDIAKGDHIAECDVCQATDHHTADECDWNKTDGTAGESGCDVQDTNK